MHNALRSNRELLEAAGDELQRLRVTLAGTSFSQARSHERLMPITNLIGVNLAEESVCTTAPGITAHTGQTG